MLATVLVVAFGSNDWLQLLVITNQDVESSQESKGNQAILFGGECRLVDDDSIWLVAVFGEEVGAAGGRDDDLDGWILKNCPTFSHTRIDKVFHELRLDLMTSSKLVQDRQPSFSLVVSFMDARFSKDLTTWA